MTKKRKRMENGKWEMGRDFYTQTHTLFHDGSGGLLFLLQRGEKAKDEKGSNTHSQHMHKWHKLYVMHTLTLDPLKQKTGKENIFRRGNTVFSAGDLH